jgi:mannobiose 2-epimerase
LRAALWTTRSTTAGTGSTADFYDTGTAFGAPANRDKIWWTQAEGLNALLLLHERFGRETPRYGEAFSRQWEFIQNHQIDKNERRLVPTVRHDGTPISGQAKSNRWTEGYHQAGRCSTFPPLCAASPETMMRRRQSGVETIRPGAIRP